MSTKEKMEVVSVDKETGKWELLSMRETVNYLSCFCKKETIETDLRKGKVLYSPYGYFQIIGKKGA